MKNKRYIKSQAGSTITKKTFIYQGYELDVNSNVHHDRDMARLLAAEGLNFTQRKRLQWCPAKNRYWAIDKR